jgi:hypothetical protein
VPGLRFVGHMSKIDMVTVLPSRHNRFFVSKNVGGLHPEGHLCSGHVVVCVVCGAGRPHADECLMNQVMDASGGAGEMMRM